MSNLSSDNIQNINEIPILFMILNGQGNIILKHSFSNDLRINEHMIASFLMAINIFGSEAFSYSSQLEEIKFDNYSVNINSSNNLHYIYIYKGRSHISAYTLGMLMEFIEKEIIFSRRSLTGVSTEIFLPKKIELQINSLIDRSIEIGR